MDWARSKLTSVSSSLKTFRRSKSKDASADQKEDPHMVAPHPIPKGKENVPCPINGMFLSKEAEEAREELEKDPDIQEERKEEKQALVPTKKLRDFIPMQVIHGAHCPSEATRRLVEEVGLEKLQRFTEQFYQRCFVDPHIDRFIAEHSEPHGRRFASWIAEKLGSGNLWTQERRTRPKKFMHFGDETMQVSHDRSSSHFAAWYSPKPGGHRSPGRGVQSEANTGAVFHRSTGVPLCGAIPGKREPEKLGQHFKPEETETRRGKRRRGTRDVETSRRWRRGMYEEHPEFMDYYQRFIGHFISIYSSKSPPFTRESARWSADPANIERYQKAGNRMLDVLGKDVDQELQRLPEEERSLGAFGVELTHSKNLPVHIHSVRWHIEVARKQNLHARKVA
ncbi:unnamed protein product [Durusdinium trenchii]|uniref:Uncharacterized protein n=1 Tax=Durusdinium trenchii TaxID=1381693 RepID=A0ABP0S282_9DINO